MDEYLNGLAIGCENVGLVFSCADIFLQHMYTKLDSHYIMEFCENMPLKRDDKQCRTRPKLDAAAA